MAPSVIEAPPHVEDGNSSGNFHLFHHGEDDRDKVDILTVLSLFVGVAVGRQSTTYLSRGIVFNF